MTGNRFPFVGSGRQKEGGELATRKQDFNAHVQGNGFRHDATMIGMNPPISVLGGTTVQQTLEEFTTLVTSTGTGFISIGNAGDGYALGTYNMGTVDTPTLKDAFNAAFLDPRLQNGGVILLLAGTYVLASPVTVPPGISIIGEIGGTLIIGEMVEESMFIISSTIKDININGDSGSGDIDLNSGSNVEKVRFSNLTLADNLNGTVASGGSSMTTVPMIALQNSANFDCNNVSFLGRVNDGSITDRDKTLNAIGTVAGGSVGTTLSLNECFFDGFKVAVNFVPALGDKDFIVVSNCKIRTFGTEGTASIPLNSAIVASLCNINLSNNYFIGAGTITNTFLNITSTGGITSDIRVVVTGTSGSPSSRNIANLIQNDSGVTFSSVISGNNWGNEVDNPWYIVVGGTNGIGPLGDIFGPAAIDIILNMSTNNYQGTVIVNPGTYVVQGHAAANNFTRLKFIGNKIGKKYPVIQLNLTATATDSLLNKFLVVGNHLESLQFVSLVSTHSIRPSFNAISNTTQTAANDILIKDCIFTDISLNALDIGVGPFNDFLGNAAKLRILVDNCTFNQTGFFSETVSLVLPPSHVIHVRDCNFYGVGYAVNIGNPTYVSANFSEESYIFENVTCDQTGYSISSSAPGTSTIDSYFVVDSGFAHITMINCQILCTNTLGVSTSRVSGSLATTFFNYVTLHGKSVDIDKCLFNGPTQTFNVSGTDYVMPTVHIEPRQSCKITNSRFVNGGLPLQIGGSTAFVDTLGDGCYIANNTFISSATTVTMTLLDFDIDIASNALNDGHIGIHNNYFRQAAGSAIVQVRHTEQTDTYVSQGIVQIYAPFFDVKFCNNKVYGQLTPPVVNPYLHFAGLVVNTWNATTAADGGSASSVHLSDNRFDVINAFNGISTNSTSCAWIKTPVINIHHNYFSMNNPLGSGISNFAGCLYLDGHATSSFSYTDSIVTGNFFSRRALSGAASNLSGGYIYIATGSSSRGMIIDNSFSDTTFDGSDVSLLVDNSSDANKWAFYRNKNQQVTIYVKANTGIVTNSHNSLVLNSQVFNSYDPTDINVYINNEASITGAGSTLQISSNGTGEPNVSGCNIQWRFSLYDVLPPFVHLVSISEQVTYDTNIPNLGTDSVFLTLIRDGSVIDSDTISMHSGAGSLQTLGPITPTFGTNTRLDYSDGFVVSFNAQFQANVAFVLQAYAIAITYKW